MGKTFKAKTPPGDFKVITLENPLLSKQAITSKGIPVPYTNLQLNPYPNIQLDLFCSENFSFSMHGSQYVTNQLMHESKYVTNHQLEKDVGSKVLQFINMMIAKLLIYVQGCAKRKSKQVQMDMCEIRFEKLIFINLDRWVIYRAAVKHRAEDPF